MTYSDEIKTRIENFYKDNTTVHISAEFTEPKESLRNEPALIKGAYPHLFTFKLLRTGARHTMSYSDVVTKQIVIAELAEE